MLKILLKSFSLKYLNIYLKKEFVGGIGLDYRFKIFNSEQTKLLKCKKLPFKISFR